MQPPKVNSKPGASQLAREADQAGKDAGWRTDDQGQDTAMPASEDDNAAHGARDIADAQDKVVRDALTRLPPG